MLAVPLHAEESSPGRGIQVRVYPTNCIRTITSAKGSQPAVAQRFYFERPGGPTNRWWLDELITVYVPSTGCTWTGQTNSSYLVALNDSIIGFGGLLGSKMSALISTNRYQPGLTLLDDVFKSERDNYCNLKRTHGIRDPYWISVGTLFENLPFEIRSRVFTASGSKTMLTGVTVEGTNAVITFQLSTELIGKVTFNSELKPVWVTTNGVPIGPIPTNSVFFIENSDARIPKVVY